MLVCDYVSFATYDWNGMLSNVLCLLVVIDDRLDLCGYMLTYNDYFLNDICLVVAWVICLHEKYALMLFAYMPTSHDDSWFRAYLLKC